MDTRPEQNVTKAEYDEACGSSWRPHWESKFLGRFYGIGRDRTERRGGIMGRRTVRTEAGGTSVKREEEDEEDETEEHEE
jgi:hypothetical protein